MKKVTRLAGVLLATLGLTAGTAHADLLGAGIGGLIGSQFGSGNGKIAMAALGAVVGDRMTQSTPIIASDNYGYAPPPITYGYQPRIYAPSYNYAPPVVVRVPTPIYYQNNNYAYRQDRHWNRGYEGDYRGHGGYGRMHDHREGFERHY